MPYIKQSDRPVLDKGIEELTKVLTDSTIVGQRAKAGALNYIVSKLIIAVIEDDKRYDTMNSMIGMLECCKIELYRRIIGNYENEAIDKNGDII